MRGFALLVLFGVACSASATNEPTEAASLGQAGTEAGGGSSGSPGAAVAGAAPSVAGAGAAETAGAPAGGKAGMGGAAGAGAGHGGVSAGAPSQAGAGGGAGTGGKSSGGAGGAGSGGLGGSVGGQPAGGSSGGAAAGEGGAPNQCTGFTTYTVDVNTCLSVTGDYQMQTDPGCASSGIVSRDHCSTCVSWTTITKPLTVMLSLADGVSVKRYDAPSGVCPANCKYICN